MQTNWFKGIHKATSCGLGNGKTIQFCSKRNFNGSRILQKDRTMKAIVQTTYGTSSTSLAFANVPIPKPTSYEVQKKPAKFFYFHLISEINGHFFYFFFFFLLSFGKKQRYW